LVIFKHLGGDGVPGLVLKALLPFSIANLHKPKTIAKFSARKNLTAQQK